MRNMMILFWIFGLPWLWKSLRNSALLILHQRLWRAFQVWLQVLLYLTLSLPLHLQTMLHLIWLITLPRQQSGACSLTWSNSRIRINGLGGIAVQFWHHHACAQGIGNSYDVTLSQWRMQRRSCSSSRMSLPSNAWCRPFILLMESCLSMSSKSLEMVVVCTSIWLQPITLVKLVIWRLRRLKPSCRIWDLMLEWKKGCQAFLTAWEHKICDLAELDPEAVIES